jgi:glyoxylase-like metal-dependent hydrolase (beta-lactamase superfamily II)
MADFGADDTKSRQGDRGMQITGNIFQVGGAGFTADSDAAVYLVRGSREAALVDAGCGFAMDRLMENIRATGTDPETIAWLLLTHCHFDHAGGASRLRRKLGCRVVAHALDAVFIEQGDDQVTAATWYGTSMPPCAVDVKITDESHTLTVEENTSISAVHLPGHSPGSLVYLTESDSRKVLFAQDVHGPLDPSFHSNRRHYQASLKRMLAIEGDILCEGHFGVVKGRKSIRKFIGSFITS